LRLVRRSGMPARARAGQPRSQRMRRRTTQEGLAIVSSFGFGRYPGEVRRQPPFDWDRNDLREFVRMSLAQRLLERRIALGRRLDEHRVLRVMLYRALPAVDRAARREDVDACRELLLDHQVSEA